MSLTDLLKVKRLANNLNFMRLYFLKSSKTYSSSKESTTTLEIIDAILAIFLFEITRATRTSSIYSRD